MLTLHQQGNILITIESVKEKECKGEVNIGGGGGGLKIQSNHLEKAKMVGMRAIVPVII